MLQWRFMASAWVYTKTSPQTMVTKNWLLHHDISFSPGNSSSKATWL
jgi:hypothetical protein